MSKEFELSVDEALERLEIQPDYDAGSGPAPCVHSIRQAGPIMLGAHWYLSQVREAMEKYGVAEAGELAKGSGHGVVIVDDTGPVFLATKENDG